MSERIGKSRLEEQYGKSFALPHSARKIYFLFQESSCTVTSFVSGQPVQAELSLIDILQAKDYLDASQQGTELKDFFEQIGVQSPFDGAMLIATLKTQWENQRTKSFMNSLNQLPTPEKHQAV